jgi:hypothetical protein
MYRRFIIRAMVTIDRRTRGVGERYEADPSTFVEATAGALVEANGLDAGRGATRLGLPALTLEVEGDAVTFEPGDGPLTVRSGGGGAVVVGLDRDAFSELTGDATSTFGLQMVGRAEIRQGTSDDFVLWEPVLRSLLDGRPVYEPGSVSFADRAGRPLDLHRTFTLDDDPREIGHFLAEAGFLHIEGLFSEDEMAAVSAELDDAIADAELDDGASWWARTEAGEWYASRILGFNQKSPTLRELLRRPGFTELGTFTDDTFVQRDPDVGDSAEGLLKKVGVTEGISDVSWHKDCAMGGHSRTCCGLTVGISVTGAGRENGELGAVAGSHRANVAPLGTEAVDDLPKIPLPTRTGDVTVHCSCTLHMSRPPVSAERRVVYTGFGLALRPGDHRPELTPEEIRANRAVLNDHVRDQRRESVRLATFDL